jgi:hypothetical protein
MPALGDTDSEKFIFNNNSNTAEPETRGLVYRHRQRRLFWPSHSLFNPQVPHREGHLVRQAFLVEFQRLHVEVLILKPQLNLEHG